MYQRQVEKDKCFHEMKENKEEKKGLKKERKAEFKN